MLLAIVALVDHHLGLDQEARATIEALPRSQLMGVAPAEIELLTTRGFLELSCGEWAAADATLEHAQAHAARR